jgi:hypothetical protein
MTIFYSVNPTDSRIFCTNARFINCSLLSVLVSCNNYYEYTELKKITFIKILAFINVAKSITSVFNARLR